MSRVDFDRYKEINRIDGGGRTMFDDMRDLVDVSLNHLRKDIVKIDKSTKTAIIGISKDYDKRVDQWK